MNIDERLQALVQTVELLASLYRDEEARRREEEVRRQAGETRREAKREALAQSVELLVSMHKDNEVRVAQIMDTMNRMGRLEGRPGA